jgi:hypothetical protein
VKNSFDAFHASRELRYSEYDKTKTSINNHEPEYLNINTTHIDKIKTITSLYIMEGGEASSSGHDLMYSAGNKFWYLYPDGDSLAQANPQLAGQVAPTLSNPGNQVGKRSYSDTNDGYGYWGLTFTFKIY